MTYIGAESILTPLGAGLSHVFDSILNGQGALKKTDNPFGDHPVGIITDIHRSKFSRIEQMCLLQASKSLEQVNANESDRWVLILSTTKGDIEKIKSDNPKEAALFRLADVVADQLDIKCDRKVISNACISGVQSVLIASELIQRNRYDHALVIGADVFSEFTYRGFASFLALSETPCMPFDKMRSGLSLGEAAASVVISNKKEIYDKPPFILHEGGTSNDANHISGPSRDGSGLARAIRKAMQSLDPKDIDFISAHGTGTSYNDDMESMAFFNTGLHEVPLNSFKGYFGHTLGAAGILEIILSIQSMREGMLVKSHGFREPGTVKDINVIEKNRSGKIKRVLKTASGFGGTNAALVLLNPEL
ncbi:MAG TPA: beta-ketoacyl synthase [Flavobacteriales bacterium]|jgi:3-oxoacyl-[acyl-carrier-protein] synthase-1|nr:beta-ketoacyl synthase [Flavobacteriales bacterium]